MRWLKILLFCVWPFISVLGQNIQPYNYPINTNNGLTRNTVYSLLQTKQGAIYIGHENVVARYKGKHFYSYPFIGKGKALSWLVELETPIDIILDRRFFVIVLTI